ncbi:MAG: hypothetical protein FWG22_03690 [Prolixibacteraceae bacterium]|nr:hypothetical protein [Prolixibacteraceae bacterium]
MSCSEKKKTSTPFPCADITEKLKKTLINEHGAPMQFRIERGVNQVAALWRETDGTPTEFEQFIVEHFIADEKELFDLYTRLERNFEILGGNFHRMDVALKEPLHLVGPEIRPIDMMFGSYDPSAHLTEDFFNNKIAFITALNFPFYSLKEKTENSATWSRRDWAYARMGDVYTSRVPADVIQNASQVLTASDAYISDYNIYMGKLMNDKNEILFPEDLKLITHWGLRDELKQNYATANGLEKQRMIYKVMQRIIDQSIPQQVINSGEFSWNPYSNKIFKNGVESAIAPEPDKRYATLLANFHVMRAVDAYNSNYPTFIIRAFENGMEIPQEDVEKLFVELVSSPQVKETASFISKKLNRELEPFDIWYNGFKAAGSISDETLTSTTQKKYPDNEALRKDIPDILQKLGWSAARAQHIASLITVDASRGAGHAWGAEMRNDLAHLRTRIGPDGMDYKGYNIAVHELGHNVEQTITMNDVDYYMLNGVPNTAFTEATAFLFQKRDLDLLGIKTDNSDQEAMMALDNFWACYEIMGVSLVDMQVWKWMYQHPDATPEQLKNQVITIAKDVWNRYFAGILGGKDEPILAIYSHMIDNPLYLSNYPIGHIIDFQIEQQVKGKKPADEIDRMYTQGRLAPQVWMKGAVGSEISIKPILAATSEALKKVAQ